MRTYAFIILFIFMNITPLNARDNGQYAQSPLKSWFDKLASGKGLCCSFADGVSIQDADWDTQDNGYIVRLCTRPPEKQTPDDWNNCKDKSWFVVPDSALVPDPNKFGQAVVWPYRTDEGRTGIRCFMPGTGT